MIIDSPIISGSFAASGSLNQVGNITITGSLTVTGDITGNITGSATNAVSASFAANANSSSFAANANSASFAATASFALNVPQTASFAISASNAATASYLSNYIPPFPFTGSAGISGSLVVNGNITAQTLVVQTITSSQDFVTGSTKFGSIISNTHQFTGSVTVSGSLAVNDSNVIISSQTSSMSVATASYWSGSILNATSASFASTASYWSGSINNALSASFADTSTSSSFATTASFSLNVPVTASFANTATSASFATTASFSLNVPVTSSYANNANSASYALTASFSLNVPVTASFANNATSASFANNATSASFATTASYLTGYISPFPYTGSAIISGSLVVTGSVAASNLQGVGVRYLVTDASGSVTAQTASAAIKQTQAFTSSANQTSFTIDNGYTTGLVDVFINGSKLAPGVEFTDTTGTVITLATGSNSGDLVEFVKYFPASGVTNNALRQQTTFTASAGQTVFSASYTPGLLDIFYNGSRLSNNEYTANNGTFFTLATGSAAGDILDIFVYSYQVGAFSGIGGAGVANQVAYFGTTNAITGSPNFTISGSTMTVTGSLIVSGSGTFTNIGPAVMSGSLNISGSLAVGGSNVVLSNQTSSLNVSTASFAATASSADNLLVRNTLTAQTLVVQTITSSVDFVTGSTRFGSILGNTHQFTGSVSMTGSLAVITNGTEFQVTSTGVNFGNVIGDTHNITGSVNVSGSATFVSSVTAGGPIFVPNTLTDPTTGNATNNGTVYALNSASTNNSYGIGIGAIRNSAYDIWFQTGVINGGGYRWYIGTSEKMTMLNTGNVGIGISTPQSIFHIGAAAPANSGIKAYTGLANSYEGFLFDYYYNTAASNLRVFDIVALGASTTGIGGSDIRFLTVPQTTTGTPLERLRITNSGNVGIGTTTTDVKTHLYNASGRTDLRVESAGGDGAFATLQVKGGGTNAWWTIVTNSSAINGAVDTLSFYKESGSAGVKMVIQNNGFVGIGTNSPTEILHLNSSNTAAFIRFQNTGGSGTYLGSRNDNMELYAGGVEQMRITSDGRFMVRTTSAIDAGGVTGVSNMLNPTDDGKWALAIQNNATTNSYGRGLGIRNLTDFNNGSNEFIFCIGNTTPRLYILANGGVYNYSANNSNISDERTKKDIIPLESYWNKLKAIEIVKFKYKDQTHDDFNIGVIAQQVKSVAPEFVNEDGFGETPEDGIPLKSIYTEDLHNATIKVLQEAMAKIEEQQTLITALEEKLERNNII